MSFWKKQSMRNKVILVTVFVVLLAIVFYSDHQQQKLYALVRDAYVQMEAENYEEAVEEFQEYLDGHSTKLYWSFQKLVNGNDETSEENVRNALKECEKYLEDVQKTSEK